jgi:hypothetical protein
MPNVSGSARRRRRAVITPADAAADWRGSVMSPLASASKAWCNAVVAVMALSLSPRLKGARIVMRKRPRSRLEAMATGANRCTASNWPMLSRSRTLDHDTSGTSSTSRPCSAVKPLSTATIRAPRRPAYEADTHGRIAADAARGCQARQVSSRSIALTKPSATSAIRLPLLIAARRKSA